MYNTTNTCFRYSLQTVYLEQKTTNKENVTIPYLKNNEHASPDVKNLSSLDTNPNLSTNISDIKDNKNDINKQTTPDSRIGHYISEEKSQYVSAWLSNENQDMSIVETDHLDHSTLDK